MGGGIRGAWDGERDEDGVRYKGSSCSGARGSSNESRNLEGDIEPSTEFRSDMLRDEECQSGVREQSRKSSRGAGSPVECSFR